MCKRTLCMDGYDNEGFLGFIKAGSEIWGSDIDAESVSLYNLKFENYIREIYLNSDTAVSVLSGAPFDDNTNDFLTNAAIAEAVDVVNTTAGSTRMLGHAVVRVGQPGWMDEVDTAIEERPPASWKLYTIGDPGAGPSTKYPFWLDDEELIYPFYEKAVAAGINTMCIHKGLMPKDYETSWPDVWKYPDAARPLESCEGLAAAQFRYLSRLSEAANGYPRRALQGVCGDWPYRMGQRPRRGAGEIRCVQRLR